MKIFLLFSFLFFNSQICFSEALTVRKERIRVGTATNVYYHFSQYAELLSKIGRVTEIINTESNGFGIAKAIDFKHYTKNQINCNARKLEVGVNFIGDIYNEASKMISLIELSSQRVVDLEITSRFGTGKPAKITLYICKK
ncbi:MAG: hypothetical protein ACK5V3_01450 [Bdellovibrionales bacterium]